MNTLRKFKQGRLDFDKNAIGLFVLLLFGCAVGAQNSDADIFDNRRDSAQQSGIQTYRLRNQTFIYQKPTFWQTFKYIPQDLHGFVRSVSRGENLGWDAAVLGSTAVLIAYDQPISEEAVRIGHKMGGGWSEDSRYRKFLGLNIVPENVSSGVYYIGNGGTTLLLSGLFYGIGKLNENDYRALHTSSELIECLASVGIVTQTIKRISGRQSPVRAFADGHDGGHWTPFPSFKSFQENTPNYDAMPSGHLATYMATLTIIAMNYPELKWIKPVGYSVMGVLAFNMVSTKVHWVSDYPLGIFIGYIMGRNIAERRIAKIKDDTGSEQKSRYKLNYHIRRFEETNLYGVSLDF